MALNWNAKLLKAFFLLLFFCIIFLFFGGKQCFWNSSCNKQKPTFRQPKVTPDSPISFLERRISNDSRPYLIDVLVIFTKAEDNFVLQFNLRRSVGSLLKLSSLPIRLHIIIDDESLPIATKIMNEVMLANILTGQHVKFVYLSASNMAETVKPEIQILQEFFTTNYNSYYKDFLFFFSIFLHRLLPGVKELIMMDIDLVVRADIVELYNHFNKFAEDQILGISHDLSPVYYNLLSTYRKIHPNTTFGLSHSQGGFPGFNSGVLLLKVDKMRQSSIFQSYLSQDVLRQKTLKYSFRGSLGDQDLFTLIAFDHPELFYVLPCVWNRQRCQWWKPKMDSDLFGKFFACEGIVKLVHGNCKSEIPVYEDYYR